MELLGCRLLEAKRVMFTQRYVSDELTHFVGRGRLEEDQYRLLVKIMSDGCLRAGGDADLDEGHIRLTFRWEQKLSESELFQPSMVCFCDIPVPDLAIHVKKYGRFGLGFGKKFLIEKGAAPVFYVPKGGPLIGQPRATLLDEAGREYEKLRSLPPTENPKEVKIPVQTPIDRFLDYVVFSYLKPFDESKTEDDPDNHYMEREWRTLSSIRFTLSDVRRIIIPEAYASRLRQNVPTYVGQVTFVE